MDESPVEWVDLLPLIKNYAPSGEIRSREVWEWSLVLSSQGIEHIVESSGRDWFIFVKERDRYLAQREINLYIQENEQEVATGEKIQLGSWEPTVWLVLLLGVFYRLTGMQISGLGYDAIPWKKLGYVDVWAVTQGEWWRLISGLTLHANIAHLMGNVCIGGFFIAILCRKYGSGYGWMLVLLSGIWGNYLNFLIRDYTYNSLGFSTAVFGAVGILVGVRTLENGLYLEKKQILPLVAGLGILSLLGTGGENTDLGAHIFGIFTGVVLGTCLGWCTNRNILPTLKGNRLLGLLALAIVVGAWYLALQYGELPENIST